MIILNNEMYDSQSNSITLKDDIKFNVKMVELFHPAV